ncbi:MAG: VCBS domain-containing protein [Hyphomicrobiaceae bacterium]|nr:VCBS domain-containing protein [Hyphomicrobiaceae bacterium]
MAIPHGPGQEGLSPGGAHEPGGTVHLDAGPGGGTLILPDAGLMFRGSYARSGPDLAITGPDGDRVIVSGYFAHEHAPTLMSPDGAMLAPETVAQLAGPRFPGVIAQQGTPQPATPIGQVETAAGSVTIVHADGSRTSAAAGTHVFQGDVVETGADGRLSITFADKTNIALGESARIVLDTFVYDPAGSQSSMLFSIVQGAFVFVAGLVAPSGDMKIQTPVATMGIRGTTGVVRADVQDGTSYFTLKPDPPGKLGEPGGNVGAFDVFARLNGVLIKEVRVPDQLLIVRNAAGQFQDLPQIGANEAAFQQDIVNFAFASHQQMLQRLDTGQPPVEQTPPGGPRRGEAPGDGIKHAGLAPGIDKVAYFRDPLAVDLIKQTDPLGNEEGSRQDFDAAGMQNAFAPLLAAPPMFTTPPLAVVFSQTPAQPGIHADVSLGYSSSSGLSVSIQSVVITVTAVSFAVNGNPAQPIALTPEQIQAFASAFDAAAGRFDLSIDTSFLGLGQQVIITATVTIADSRGGTATQVEVFSIVGANDAPTLAPVAVHLADTAAADTLAAVSGTLVGQDADTGAQLTYAIAGATASQGATTTVTPYGVLTLLANGSYTFVPDNAAVDALGQGEHATIAVPVTVSDGIAAPVPSTLSIVIDGANDAPTLAPVQVHLADADGPYCLQPISGTLVGQDADAGAQLSYAVVGAASVAGVTTKATAYGVLTLLADGSYTFAPNGAAVDALGQGEHATTAIPVSVSDGIAAPVTSTLTIVIDGANDLPAISAGHGNVAAVTFTPGVVEANDGAVTIYPGQGAPPGAMWQPVDLSQNAQWTVKLYFGPGQGFAGPHSADGITFALQTAGPTAIGAGGGALGIAGIGDAIGVKFDTYPLNPGDTGVPWQNFAQFFTRGDVTGNEYPAKQLLPVLADGQYHDVSISWDAATQTLTYTIDGYTSSIQRDIVATDFNGQSLVYAGFTGSGGDAYALEKVQVDTISNGASGLVAERLGVTGSSEMRTVSGSLTFADADLSDVHRVSVVAPDCATLGSFQASIVSDANGRVTVHWTYQVQDAALDWLATNQLVVETFEIVLSDGHGSTSQDVTITLAGTSAESCESGTPATPLVTADAGALSQAIVGSSQDEVIRLTLDAGDSFVQQVDGRGGSNALHILGTLETVDLTQLASGQLANLQEIDLTQGVAQTLKLSISEVLQLNHGADANLLEAICAHNAAHPDDAIAVSQEHTLVVDGDHGGSGASDTLDIVDATANAQSGTWVLAGTVDHVDSLSADCGQHDIYNYVTPANEVLASVAVQHDMHVSLPNHAA